VYFRFSFRIHKNWKRNMVVSVQYSFRLYKLMPLVKICKSIFMQICHYLNTFEFTFPPEVSTKMLRSCK